MNRQLKEFLVSYPVITLIFYLAGSVWGASLDISKWQEYTRSIMSVFWVIFLLGFAASILSDKSK